MQTLRAAKGGRLKYRRLNLHDEISASDQVARWLRNLPPNRNSECAPRLKDWSAGGNIKPLRGELEGFYRLRVGGYRIVCRNVSGSLVQLEYADIRDVVYEAFRQLRLLSELDD